ncbi:hypothetical protein ACH9DO_06945 [Kocuria sp. M1N1S27]|uniref:hypothetical protein n=1 Tax=Kocuria kalidii TaxID=3376283 RepID=UPI0037B16670
MISFLFLMVATAAVLSVYTVIGRLADPPEDRVPWRELGGDGWLLTLRRGLAFLSDSAPSDGARFRRARLTSPRQGGHTAEAHPAR